MNWNLKSMTYEQLVIIMQKFAMQDKANINGDLTGLGFTENIAEKEVALISDYDKSFLIFNDFGLILTKKLLEKGVKEVHIAFGQWLEEYVTTKNGKTKKSGKVIFNEEKLYNLYERLPIIKATPEIKLVKMNDNNKKFDLVIMNPPYSKGNVITKNIVDSLDFDCLVNLMPIKCYKPNNLYMHIIPQSIIHSDNTTQFSDAFVTPIIATLSKNILTNTSDNFEVFELCCVYDQRLQKYWHEQLNRNQTFLVQICSPHKKDFASISSKTSYSCGIYTPNIMLKNGPKTIKNTDGSFKLSDRHYIWNFLKPNNSIDNYFTPTTLANDDLVINQTVTVFATEHEADNFKAWAHSGELSGKGRLRGLFSILLRAMNKPTGCPFRYVIPRVDWSRSWTDEEILADYGYTAEEIEEILHFNDDI